MGNKKIDLKGLVFSKAKKELDDYMDMLSSAEYTEEEKELQRNRFCSVYQIIEDADLEDEYQEWKNTCE